MQFRHRIMFDFLANVLTVGDGPIFIEIHFYFERSKGIASGWDVQKMV